MVLDTVRALIQDNGTSHRTSDDDLLLIMQSALDELNVWAESTWTLSQFDLEPCPVPLSHQQIFMLIVKIRIVDATMTDINKGMKFVTQDVQMDGSATVTRLNRTKMLLEQELDRKLTYWLGIKRGAKLQHTGESWGGV